jgi:hypothetical protein
MLRNNAPNWLQLYSLVIKLKLEKLMARIFKSCYSPLYEGQEDEVLWIFRVDVPYTELDSTCVKSRQI